MWAGLKLIYLNTDNGSWQGVGETSGYAASQALVHWRAGPDTPPGALLHPGRSASHTSVYKPTFVCHRVPVLWLVLR